MHGTNPHHCVECQRFRELLPSFVVSDTSYRVCVCVFVYLVNINTNVIHRTLDSKHDFHEHKMNKWFLRNATVNFTSISSTKSLNIFYQFKSIRLIVIFISHSVFRWKMAKCLFSGGEIQTQGVTWGRLINTQNTTTTRGNSLLN